MRSNGLASRRILCILVFAFLVCGGCKRTGNLWADESAGDSNIKRFVNSRANLTGRHLQNYVDFSFNYPGSWAKDPLQSGASGSPNYITVEKKTGTTS